MAKVLLEVCCGSVDEALAAHENGADRIELCCALAVGGLTPALGMLEEVKSWATYPVMAMTRSREGGFHYTAAEFDTMVRDAKILLNHGADGIVFGFLHQDGTVDVERTARMVDIAGGAPTMFHRACDATPDLFATMETLAELGVTRMLTSGGAGQAALGASVLAELVRRAEGRIEVLPGGAIEPDNVVGLVQTSGVTQVHFAARDNADQGGYAGVAEAVPAPAVITGIRQALADAGL
ncbi:MAG: copper homeostasis protein CutC [Armatimonadetes bacterium]|nr:copper homeostasis protein CutC [Armatimonadota bacterium]